jgi:hypothetical protein
MDCLFFRSFAVDLPLKVRDYEKKENIAIVIGNRI